MSYDKSSDRNRRSAREWDAVKTLRQGNDRQGNEVREQKPEVGGLTADLQLVEMRDRWHGFSMDAKRHQKERETWWHCSQELRELLKSYFDGGKA